MSALNVDSLQFEEKKLHVPELLDIKNVLSQSLQNNFKHVAVEIVDCPDLRKSPFHLAAEGLSGSESIVEIGGPPYLLPIVNRTKIYDLKKIAQKVQPPFTNILAIGAGAGYFPMLNTNCEGIYNMVVDATGSTANSKTHFASIVGSDEKCVLSTVPSNETRCSLLMNIFMSEGKPGKIIRVHCKQRTGSSDFISSIRNALSDHYVDELIGLGGVFLMKQGKFKQHVMRDFSQTPIFNEKELNNWLKFIDMPAALIAVGTLMNRDADLDLRLQHFHSFSTDGYGGHYHIDTTPEIVEYEGYFNVGTRVVRIDKPLVTHQFGRD